MEDILGIEEIQTILSSHVKPHVAGYLKGEAAGFTEEDVDQFKKGLREVFYAERKFTETPTVDEFEGSLENLADDLSTVSDEEIIDYSNRSAGVMASGWVQYLALALKSEPEIPLTKSLLPRETTAIDSRVQEAYNNTFHPLPINKDEVPSIMEKLAETLFEGKDRVEIPLNISIEKTQNGYVAKRHDYQQD